MNKIPCKLTTKHAMRSAGPVTKLKKGDAAPPGTILQDNQDGSFTIFGQTQSGAAVDISAVATITVTSADPAIASVDSPVGVTDKFHGVKAGTTKFTIVATWTDGSVGPFTIDAGVTVTTKPDPITGLAVTFDPPVARP